MGSVISLLTVIIPDITKKAFNNFLNMRHVYMTAVEGDFVHPLLVSRFLHEHTYQQLRIFNILLAGTLIFSILKQDLEFSTSCLQVLKFPTLWWQDLENLQSQKLWSYKDSRSPVYKLRLLFNQVQIIDQIISSHWTLL